MTTGPRGRGQEKTPGTPCSVEREGGSRHLAELHPEGGRVAGQELTEGDVEVGVVGAIDAIGTFEAMDAALTFADFTMRAK
ncbi:hypothetical protein ACWEWI_26210 [Streptomyces sp. NPDC003753]